MSQSCFCLLRHRGDLKINALAANSIVLDHVCVPSPHIFKLVHWQEVSIIHIQNDLAVTNRHPPNVKELS